MYKKRRESHAMKRRRRKEGKEQEKEGKEEDRREGVKQKPIRLMVLMRLKRVGKRQQTTDLNDCDYNEVLRTETTLDELSRN